MVQYSITFSAEIFLNYYFQINSYYNRNNTKKNQITEQSAFGTLNSPAPHS